MKKLFLFTFIVIVNINAQDFFIEKVTGNVKLLKATSDRWEEVYVGQKLSESDLIMTDNKSSIMLTRDKEKFLLKNDMALGLNHIKKISIEDLVLALALDEIRNVPKIKRNTRSMNTAVYGSEALNNSDLKMKTNSLGEKKLKGAKLLNENGYVESSIIAAREVFRNYPETASSFENRLYFADLLKDLELYQEALSEYSKIEKLNISKEQLKILDEKNEEVSIKLMEEK